MGALLERRPAPQVPFLRNKKSKTKEESSDLVGPALGDEKRAIPRGAKWEAKHGRSQLWRMDLQEVLAKTIAMIRGSKEYQDYQRRCRKTKSRGNRQDKYHQSMTYEYKAQE